MTDVLKIGFPNESASMFLGTSRARMRFMVGQNRVRGPYTCVTDDYDEAEDCACEDVGSEIYWGQLLAAAKRLGKSLTELGLEIEGGDFEKALARFIAENGEDDLVRLERGLPEELRKLTAEASYDRAGNLHSRDRASLENRPVIMILDGGLIRSRGYLATEYKNGADIHPLEEVLLGVVDVPLGIFALWRQQPMSGFLPIGRVTCSPLRQPPDRNIGRIEAAGSALDDRDQHRLTTSSASRCFGDLYANGLTSRGS